MPRTVWAYLFAAFGISWGAFFLRGAISWPTPVDETLRLIVKFGPSLAGIAAAIRFFGRDGVVAMFRRLLDVRINVGWFAFAILLPIVVLLAALPIRHLLGGSVFSQVDLELRAAFGLYGTQLTTRFFAGGGLGEELGWRGFMLPVLQDRVGAFRASLIIGLAHGAWHLPAYGVGVLFLTIFTVSGAFIFTWMYNQTKGNLLLPALMHASANASLPTFEAIFPAIDNELLFPIILFTIWAAAAALLVWRVGATGLGPNAPDITQPSLNRQDRP